jgi:hypothetical protein
MKQLRRVIAQAIIFVFALLASFPGHASAADDTFAFAVMADSRGVNPGDPVNVPVLTRLFQSINTFAPEFCLFPGDLVFGGYVDNHEFKRQLQIWVGAASNFNKPIFSAPGNHEMRHNPNRDQAWSEMFPNLPVNGLTGGPKAGNYFFDFHGCRFISVLSDYEDGRVAVDQKWLNQVLDSSTGFKHVFVMGHHPMQQLGGSEGEFWTSLRRHRVAAYFCGHWHLYNRSQPEGSGTWQVVVGTAGAPPLAYVPSWLLNGTTDSDKYGFAIIKVSDSSVDVNFYGNSKGQEEYNRLIDHFVISEANQDARSYSEFKDRIIELLTRSPIDNSVETGERTHHHR